MTTTQQIPFPHPTPLTKPFWDACKRGELIAQRCRDCGKWTFIPNVACMHCFSPNIEWAATKGRGKVYSYSVVWRPQMPAFKIPYVVAIIDVDEGYQMLSNVVGCDQSQVRVGMPVEVTFQRMSEEITLPYFKPM